MIDHSEGSPRYQTMTNLLSPSSLSSSSSSSPSSITTCSNHHDLHCPSSVYHHSSEVIVSPHRSSVLIHSNHQAKQRSQTMDQTDSDGDLDSSSSSSCITNSSKLKKRRANLPKDSVSSRRTGHADPLFFAATRSESWKTGSTNTVTMPIRPTTKRRICPIEPISRSIKCVIGLSMLVDVFYLIFWRKKGRTRRSSPYQDAFPVIRNVPRHRSRPCARRAARILPTKPHRQHFPPRSTFSLNAVRRPRWY